MNFTLFPYQVAFREQLRDALRTNKRVIACLPTGGGKTKIFVTIAADAIARGRTVIILSESLTIASQIREEVGAGTVEVWMSQTLMRRQVELERLQRLGDRLLVIADEAHIGTHNKVLESLPDAYLLGFTATPDFRVAKHLPQIYQNCVVGEQVGGLVELGRLTPYRHFQRLGAKLGALRRIAGEFSEETQKLAFGEDETIDTMIRDLQGQKFRKCMIYTSSIEMCERVAARFSGRVSVVHSKKKDAGEQLREFEGGVVDICVSVGSLTKGYDYPTLDFIVLYRATTSLALYLQMIGRGGRVAEGKESFTVLDYGANGSRFGRWDMHRDWAEMWQGKVRDKSGVAPAKLCPKCLAINTIHAGECAECGHKFPGARRAKVEETQLVELSGGRMLSSLTASELHAWGRTSKNPHYAARVARTQGAAFLQEFAQVAGYKQGWVVRQLGEARGFKDRRV